jgi:hypothetical protein
VSKKIKKVKKSGKIEKKNQKNRTVKKNQLNRLKFLKNQPVRFGFGFISLKQKKQNRTKPNLNRKNKKNLSQTGKKPSQTKKPSKIDLNRFLS